MSQTDWLDTPPAPAADWLDIEVSDGLPDYLKIPELDASSIVVARPDAPLQDIRFEVMKGSDRLWACNGRYVACRPSGFHSDTRYRHEKFLRSGHYKHVGTFDDVQLFELLPGSPFYRTPGNVKAGTWYEVLRAAAQAAVARDWAAYVDLLEEIAGRLKGAAQRSDVEQDMSRERFTDTLEHLEQLIFMRWSAGREMLKAEDYGLAMSAMRAEIDNGVHEIRARRGEKSSRIAVRARPLVIR